MGVRHSCDARIQKIRINEFNMLTMMEFLTKFWTFEDLLINYTYAKQHGEIESEIQIIKFRTRL